MTWTRYFVPQRSGSNETFLEQSMVVYAMDGGSVSLTIPEAFCYNTSSSAFPVSLSYIAEPSAVVSAIYSSSNPSVATVHSSGKVLGHSVGTTIISVVVTATGPGMASASGTDSFLFTVEAIPSSGYSSPSGSQVGFEFPDVTFYIAPAYTDVGGDISLGYVPPAYTDAGGAFEEIYVPPYGTDVGFQLFTQGPSFNAIIELGFAPAIIAEIFLGVDMSISIPLNFSVESIVIPFDQLVVSVPLNFTVDGVIITFEQMTVQVPMAFGAAIQATGTGEGGAIMVPPIFGVMQIRL